MRTREGMAIARANGRLKGKAPKLQRPTARPRPRSGPDRRSHDRRARRVVLGQPRDDLPRDRPSPPRPDLTRPAMLANAIPRPGVKLPSNTGQRDRCGHPAAYERPSLACGRTDAISSSSCASSSDARSARCRCCCVGARRLVESRMQVVAPSSGSWHRGAGRSGEPGRRMHN